MKITKEEIDKVVEKNANENGFFGIENRDRTMVISFHKSIWKELLYQIFEVKE